MQDDKCRYKPHSKGATDSGFVDIDEGNEDKLKSATATIGPISVAIDASHQSFQFYNAGNFEISEIGMTCARTYTHRVNTI